MTAQHTKVNLLCQASIALVLLHTLIERDEVLEWLENKSLALGGVFLLPSFSLIPMLAILSGQCSCIVGEFLVEIILEN